MVRFALAKTPTTAATVSSPSPRANSTCDAFADPNIPPLADQNRGTACAESTRFNWGPIFIPKTEITRRIRAWGAWKKAPEKDIGPVARIEIHQVSRFGRPVLFYVTD